MKPQVGDRVFIHPCPEFIWGTVFTVDSIDVSPDTGDPIRDTIYYDNGQKITIRLEVLQYSPCPPLTEREIKLLSHIGEVLCVADVPDWDGKVGPKLWNMLKIHFQKNFEIGISLDEMNSIAAAIEKRTVKTPVAEQKKKKMGTVLQTFLEVFPEFENDKETREHIIWGLTGFPGAWRIPEDGNTPGECFRNQLKEVRRFYDKFKKIPEWVEELSDFLAAERQTKEGTDGNQEVTTTET